MTGWRGIGDGEEMQENEQATCEMYMMESEQRGYPCCT